MRSKPVGWVSTQQPRTVGLKPDLQAGFTLIELLVVITLLGIVAGVVVLNYEDVQDSGRYDATQFEMAEIKKALLQFRRDTREFPCRVYRSGDYVPDNTVMPQLSFAGLPSATSANYHTWCRNGHTGQTNWGMTMLLTFPYDNTDLTYTPLLWNPDTKQGWHGPYINNQGIVDAWGNRILLLDPELDYSPEYRCKKNAGGNYDTTGDTYSCLRADDPGWNAANYTLPANVARIVSLGENGVLDSDIDYANVAEDEWCLPKGDDIVLCLLR
ncbi:MAG: prepilin-type N-terminal cleavage/methylation domain-containing protein [Gammaproteobacteria bacterium]|nr:prepilin-type N-terminal cleavage/methylation domain-containing protein [Gammaproteobacteria bacterium]